jgi:quinol monooxygenase YgiN
MIANFVKFPVKPGRMQDFIEVSLANSRGSINGPGCYATSIFADPSGANLAYVFEVFADQQAFDNHHALDDLDAVKRGRVRGTLMPISWWSVPAYVYPVSSGTVAFADPGHATSS